MFKAERSRVLTKYIHVKNILKTYSYPKQKGKIHCVSWPHPRKWENTDSLNLIEFYEQGDHGAELRWTLGLRSVPRNLQFPLSREITMQILTRGFNEKWTPDPGFVKTSRSRPNKHGTMYLAKWKYYVNRVWERKGQENLCRCYDKNDLILDLGNIAHGR